MPLLFLQAFPGRWWQSLSHWQGCTFQNGMGIVNGHVRVMVCSELCMGRTNPGCIHTSLLWCLYWLLCRAQVGWSTEGMRRIHRHAAELLPRYAGLIAAHYAAAAPAVLQPVGDDVVPRFVMQHGSGMQRACRPRSAADASPCANVPA